NTCPKPSNTPFLHDISRTEDKKDEKNASTSALPREQQVESSSDAMPETQPPTEKKKKKIHASTCASQKRTNNASSYDLASQRKQEQHSSPQETAPARLPQDKQLEQQKPTSDGPVL